MDMVPCPHCAHGRAPVDARYNQGCILCDYKLKVEPWLAVAYALSGIDECFYPPQPGFSLRFARLPHNRDVLEARMRELKYGKPT